MKILITGDRGFVGTATKERLSGLMLDGYDLIDGYDIRDKEQFEEAVLFHSPDRILHLAAIARFPEADADPIRAYDTNVLGTKNVCEIAEQYCIPLVHASTGSVYMPIKQTPPITEDFPIMGNSVYGCSKATADLIVQKMKTPWIILRYAHLYGPEKRLEGIIGNFLKRIEHDLEPVMYGGKQSSDFCYVRDVAEANFLALTAPSCMWYNAYNIGTGEEVTTDSASKAICKAIGYKGKVLKEDKRVVDSDRFYYDITKARENLKYNPQYSFADGLEEMFDGYVHNSNNVKDKKVS
jgi:nucleoside-diphosphate-sugar epimerase